LIAPGSSRKGEFRFVYHLEPTANGTHLRLDGSLSMPNPGFFTRLCFRLMGGMFRKACVSDLQALKRYLETPKAPA
jgi:hypothetical protein